MSWPPNLGQLKTDMRVPLTDIRDDDALQMMLDAAVKVAERLREGDFDFVGDPDVDLPAPDADFELGTVRLAWRYHTRRRSPDALVNMAELGQARVPSFDTDIEALLGVGRHRVWTVSG